MKRFRLAMAMAIAGMITAARMAPTMTTRVPARAMAILGRATRAMATTIAARATRQGTNGGTLQKDHDCAVKCAAKGSYVFVVGDKVYKIADQKMKELEQHAGHKVEIEGTMKGDTITVTKVTMLKQ